MAMLTALFVSLLIGPWFIRYLKKKQKRSSNIREDVPETHLKKSGTPTMGGILILLTLLASFLLWGRWDVSFFWVVVSGTLIYGAIGFLDDYAKIKKTKGLKARSKLALQVLAGAGLMFGMVQSGFNTELQFPFFKELSPTLPAFVFVLFGVLVIVGASNAVNLTDGLDGLAIGPTLVTFFTYLFLSYVASHEIMASYLQIKFVPGAGELAVFCGAAIGAGLGFLWFNAYPAQVFMGDVGSLALGAAIGITSIVVKQELLLVLVGGVFVMEALSVMIQVVSFKTRGKRVFRMAPIHHHFELQGWAEPKVIVRFWIVSIVLSLIALTTLKLR